MIGRAVTLKRALISLISADKRLIAAAADYLPHAAATVHYERLSGHV
jgi:hypothetical protein